MKRVLIIAAHPDDDVLGCGGIMAKYKEDVEFRVIFIAEGSTCRFNFKDINNTEVKEVIDIRNNFGIEALALFGIEKYNFYNLPCGRLDQVPILDINKIIESEIRNFLPDTIFTHSDKDANNDHSVVHRSTLMATRPGASIFVGKVYAYEVLSSSEWRFTEAFMPNYFEVLNQNEVDLKWKALAAYESEIKPFPYPRSEEGIHTLAKFRGLQSGVGYAEAFELIREINE